MPDQIATPRVARRSVDGASSRHARLAAEPPDDAVRHDRRACRSRRSRAATSARHVIAQPVERSLGRESRRRRASATPSERYDPDRRSRLDHLRDAERDDAERPVRAGRRRRPTQPRLSAVSSKPKTMIDEADDDLRRHAKAAPDPIGHDYGCLGTTTSGVAGVVAAPSGAGHGHARPGNLAEHDRDADQHDEQRPRIVRASSDAEWCGAGIATPRKNHQSPVPPPALATGAGNVSDRRSRQNTSGHSCAEVQPSQNRCSWLREQNQPDDDDQQARRDLRCLLAIHGSLLIGPRARGRRTAASATGRVRTSHNRPAATAPAAAPTIATPRSHRCVRVMAFSRCP